jgi:hypothetical protein
LLIFSAMVLITGTNVAICAMFKLALIRIWMHHNESMA